MSSSTDSAWPKHAPEAVTNLIDQHFPQLREAMGNYAIEQLGPGTATVRLPIQQKNIRPGGTISGPTMFGLADAAAWIVILSEHGPVAVQSVTSSMTINFLARPEPTDLVCHASALRLGRRLAVIDCRVMSSGSSTLVAQATCNYAMPREN
ncbi:MAG: PaaI family thioesterase [Pseudomonadota bacterium]